MTDIIEKATLDVARDILKNTFVNSESPVLSMHDARLLCQIPELAKTPFSESESFSDAVTRFSNHRYVEINLNSGQVYRLIIALPQDTATEKSNTMPPLLMDAQPRYLGKTVTADCKPDEFELEFVPNPHRNAIYCARFTCPEFTSLCPVTGQPDFATLIIDYIPGECLLESKALKLWLFTFRNHGAFHEDVTVGIGQRLAKELKPHYLRIVGLWQPRGGIPIDVFWVWDNIGDELKAVIPPLPVREYRYR